MCKFRLLNADEIECRVGQCFPDAKNPTAVSILLYKDARCDMALLDEVVGPMNWQRTHSVVDGKVCCTVSIWDSEKQEWIDKMDVGTESNTEAIKGLFSDSFKRTCVNIGIGRELYTAPFIYIKAMDGENIKRTKFDLKSITYDDKGRIASLVIIDDKGNTRYTFPRGQAAPAKPQKPLKERIIEWLNNMDEKKRNEYLNYFQLSSVDAITDQKSQEIADFEKKKKAQENRRDLAEEGFVKNGG